MWWPGVGWHIKEWVASCRHCIEKRPLQIREPLFPSTLPERPFQKVGVDICEFKNSRYLVQVDYFSRYIDIAYLPGLTTAAVIGKMKNFFAQHGVPEVVVSDNGPQFSSSEFRAFSNSKEWSFQHITNSPRYLQSNGAAERAVRTAKDILRQDDILALLTYRSTPIPDLGVSPAELAIGIKLRTSLPTLPPTLMHHTINSNQVQERDLAFI